tara:strand:- start:260 stop:529 length:270 start_codon:yes stop_codon:yes gene_type:complete
MSNPNPTNEMADWLQDNLGEWLDCMHSHRKYKDFVLLCIMPHISSYGINAMFEFVKEDYDDDELPFYIVDGSGEERCGPELRNPMGELI